MARYSNGFIQYLDGSGNPLAGGKVYFYSSGTTTLTNTYADSGLTIPNPNPMILDGAGRLIAPFLNGNCRVVLKDKDDNQISEMDPVQGSLSESQWSDWSITTTYGVSDIVRGSDLEYYISLTGNNLGNDPTSSPASWSQTSFVTIWNANQSYSENDNVFESGTQYKSLVDNNLNNLPSTSPAEWGTPTGGVVAGNPVSVLTNDVPYLEASNNLSDVVDSSASRTNLDVYSTGEVYSAGEVDTALSGKLDTTATAADSQLLDSLDSTQFLRADVDSATTGQISGITPTAAAHLTRKDYVDDKVLNKNWVLKWSGSNSVVPNSWGDGEYMVEISIYILYVVVTTINSTSSTTTRYFGTAPPKTISAEHFNSNFIGRQYFDSGTENFVSITKIYKAE